MKHYAIELRIVGTDLWSLFRQYFATGRKEGVVTGPIHDMFLGWY